MLNHRQNWPCPELALALCLGLVCGCAAVPELFLETRPSPLASEPLPALSLFEGWSDGPRVSFERNLGRWNPDLEPHHLSPEDRLLLEEALAGFDERAMRLRRASASGTLELLLRSIAPARTTGAKRSSFEFHCEPDYSIANAFPRNIFLLIEKIYIN